jgi:hypothetical protein
LLKRHPLIAFFTLSYAIAWPGWWLEAAEISSISWLGSFAGYFGPAIAALLVAAMAGGKEGLEGVLARLFQWRVPFKWVLVAMFLPAGSVLVVIAILSLTGNAAPGLAAGRWVDIFPQLALVLVWGSLYFSCPGVDMV